MVSRIDLTGLTHLQGFPLGIDQMLLQLRRGDSSVAVTRLLESAELDLTGGRLSVTLQVPLTADRELFQLQLDLRLAGITFYRASSSVMVIAGQSVETDPIIPLYIGPGLGADSMTLVVVPPLMLSGGVAVATAVVLDAGSIVSGVPVEISTSDTSALRATPTALNITTLSAAPTASGSYTVTARTPTGLTGSVSVTVVDPATVIDSVFAITTLLQNVIVNQLAGVLPTIKVLDLNQQPMAGVPVIFALAGGGGLLQGGNTVTNAAGEASPGLWRIGQLVGLNTLTSTVAGAPAVVFQATGLPTVPLDIVKLSGDLQADSLLRTLLQPLVARVRDSFTNPVPGVPYSWSASDGTISPASGTTDSGGQVQGSWTLGALQALPIAILSAGPAQTSFSATTLLPLPPIRLSFPGVPGVPVGLTAVVRVGVDTAPSSRLAIALASGNRGIFTVALPDTVYLNPGQTSGTAVLLGVSLGTATLNATAPGFAGASLPVEVRPGP